MQEIFSWLLAGLFGACFGSFVSCVSYRLPLGKEFIRTPSYCPGCHKKLTLLDLFPIASWMASRGRCRHCKAPVSIRYPLTELATAASFIAIYAQFGLSLNALILAVLAVALMVMIVVDFEHYIIPDSVQVIGIVLGILYGLLNGLTWEFMLLGAACGFGFGCLLHYGYKHIRKIDALGFGDVKFFGVAGIWLGALDLIPFLTLGAFIGIFLGVVWKKLTHSAIYPFGPALAITLFLFVLYPEMPAYYWNLGAMIKGSPPQ